MKKQLAILGSVLMVTFLSHSPAWAADDEKLKGVIASSQRPAEEKARDVYRKPYESLQFIGIKENMTVLETGVGGGWYTHILEPYLKDKGKYIGEVRGQSYAGEGTLDAVLDFRNAHNWLSRGDGNPKAWFKALKKGGVVGLEDHRADEGKTAARGYVTEKQIIAVMEEVGFKYVGRSDILSNPKDTKDYSGGVWTLPPTLSKKDVEKEKYLAIGESDRMLLKFVKP